MAIKNILYMGSPYFSVPSLHAVHQSFNVVAVYTQPPRDGGRKGQMKTPIHLAAKELNLPVFTPEKLRGAALEQILATPIDALCVVGFGMLLPKALVESRLCLNVHPSALPRWRGATPVQSAIMAGDASTEVCIMQLEEGMDTGPVYDRTSVAIPSAMTTGELNDIVWAIGAKRLVHVLNNIENLKPAPQPTQGVTAAVKLTAESRILDWTQPAPQIHNHIRGLTPQPGTVTSLLGEVVKLQGGTVITSSGPQKPGEILHIDGDGMVIASAQNAIHISHLQRPGKKMQPVAEVARGWAALVPGVIATRPPQP